MGFGEGGFSVQEIILTAGYAGIALLMFLECVFPPIPSEIILPFAGFLVAQGDIAFPGVLIASVIGSLAGALTLYFLGRWSSDHILRQFLQSYGHYLRTSEAEYDRVLRVFDRYGEGIVFFGRLVPVIRSLVSIPAGANRMQVIRFVVLTSIGLVIWNTVLITAGILLGREWETAADIISRFQTVIVIALVLAVAGVVSFFIFRMTRPPAGAS
ncbi:MAG TPA: DedA family protein [Aggregatilineales bacterium]|nr:DedA family protein [Aggregatilineales bacterium]